MWLVVSFLILKHSVSGLSISFCISFNASGQDEHNYTILEALALFIDKLLAKTYSDPTWPYVGPILKKYGKPRKTESHRYLISVNKVEW